jgi:hypothetical protein
MGIAEWVKDDMVLIKRIAVLEEMGFSVTLNHEGDFVELIVRKRS